MSVNISQSPSHQSMPLYEFHDFLMFGWDRRGKCLEK